MRESQDSGVCHYSVLRQAGKRAWSQIWSLVLPRKLEWAHRLVWCFDHHPHLQGTSTTPVCVWSRTVRAVQNSECGWMMAAKAKGNCQATRTSSTGTLSTEVAFWGGFRCTNLSNFSKPAGHHTELLDSTKVTPLVHNHHRPSKSYTWRLQ